MVVVLQQSLTFYNANGFDEFLKSMRQYKLTNTEVASYFFTFIPPLFVLWGDLALLRNKGPELTELMQKIATFYELYVGSGNIYPLAIDTLQDDCSSRLITAFKAKPTYFQMN